MVAVLTHPLRVRFPPWVIYIGSTSVQVQNLTQSIFAGQVDVVRRMKQGLVFESGPARFRLICHQLH